MARSAGKSSSRCIRAGRGTRCRSITSPTACMCRPGIPPRPMRSGPRPAARIVGATSPRTWDNASRPSSTKRSGPCAAMPARTLVREVRVRLAAQLSGRGHPPEVVALGETVLDPNVLTLGFARRFTDYKRPDLLLHDRARLAQVALRRGASGATRARGQGSPGRCRRQADDSGMGRRSRRTRAIGGVWCFWRTTTFRWRNNWSRASMSGSTRRAGPWEACGTSGMKVLVNGGLNLSTLDGWWEEAYAPGPRLGDRRRPRGRRSRAGSP